MFLLSFCNNHELKIFLDIADTNTESSEPIQLDVTSASSVVPSPQVEAIMEKVLRSSRHSFCHKLIQSS